jgi:hypothetical protein
LVIAGTCVNFAPFRFKIAGETFSGVKIVNAGTCDENVDSGVFGVWAGNLRKPREISGRMGVQDVGIGLGVVGFGLT